jgi:gamma-glutamylcyclotransferase (GGCT)/AIG2-like uncharacterized protein YtfP
VLRKIDSLLLLHDTKLPSDGPEVLYRLAPGHLTAWPGPPEVSASGVSASRCAGAPPWKLLRVAAPRGVPEIRELIARFPNRLEAASFQESLGLGAERFEALLEGLRRAPPLFVYGTLRSGERAHGALGELEGRPIPALLPGQLRDLGRYPGLIRESGPSTETVVGELVALADPERRFPELDDYEGSEYERVLDFAMTESGLRLAWVYALKDEGGTPIPGGDWRAWVRRGDQ